MAFLNTLSTTNICIYRVEEANGGKMLIRELNRKQGETFSGCYRVMHPSNKYSRQGVPFQVFQLADRSGVLPAFLWLEQLAEPPQLVNNSFVQVSGVLRVNNEQCTATIRSIRILEVNSDPIRLIPSSWCQNQNLLERLHDICNSIEILPLRKLLLNIFSNNSICERFVSIPASIEHHHSYESGMLEHAVECAEMVRSIRLLDKQMSELAQVAAILHDIGKVRTMTCRGFSDAGFILHHDLLTLEIIAPYLTELESEWPNGALALRYLLCWRNVPFRQSSPLIAAAEAVIASDRLSCAVNLEKRAFDGRPAWHTSAKLGNTNRYWRPTLPNPTNSEPIRCLAINTATA